MSADSDVGCSNEQRSDVVQDYTCSTCSKSDQTTQASNYCPECDVCYCKLCLCDHNVLGRSNVTQWGKVTGTGGIAGGQPDKDEKLTCLKHPQYNIELYCEDHDVVCCRLCQSTEHRLCLNMDKIEDVAEERTINDDIQNIHENIRSLKRKADTLSEESEVKKQFTESSHSKYVTQLLEMKTNISAKFDQIKKQSDRRKQHYINKFNMDQFQCTDIKIKMPKLISTLEPSPDVSTHFVKVKRTKEYVDESNKKMSSIIATEIKGVFEELPLDGENKILDVLTAEAYFKMSGLKFRVRIKEDKVECEIVGICQIRNCNLVLADKANKSLKQLNTYYNVINHYTLQEAPNDVCAIAETEVAIATQNKVIIVNVGTEFEIVRSLEMPHGCLQLAYHGEKFYITDYTNCHRHCPCGTKVYMCDKFGKAIADFKTSNNRHSSNINQRPIAINPDGKIIYATSLGDYTSFDPEGNRTDNNTHIHNVVGMSTDESGNLFACSCSSKTVFKLSQTDTSKNIKTVLSLEERDKTPMAICYDEKLGRVVVRTEKGDYIYLE